MLVDNVISKMVDTYLRSWALPEKLPIVQPFRKFPEFFLVNFRNKIIFYGEELLAPRPTPKLEDHPLSAVRDCLFNIFAATLHIWGPFPPSAPWGRAMPWWQGTHLTWHVLCLLVQNIVNIFKIVYELYCILQNIRTYVYSNKMHSGLHKRSLLTYTCS
jgi:hypothetical protein